MKSILSISFFLIFWLAAFSYSTPIPEEAPSDDGWGILVFFHGHYLNLEASTLWHILVEAALVLFVTYLYFQKSYKPEVSEELTPKEIEQLIEEWRPEPLSPPYKAPETTVPLVSSSPGALIEVDGKQTINFGTANFLGLSTHAAVKERAVAAVKKYGVGTCGPRGFYGTIDTHLDLEKQLAQHMNAEEAVIYSSYFNTISSVIPAFSGRGDIIICDRGCSYGIQLGVELSRAEFYYFEHNNLEELEAIMKKIKETDLKTKRKLTKRFIVVEGIYQNFGDICPLDKIVALRNKYCYRIILDDSIAFGALGKRGTLDYFNIPSPEVEIYTSSMATSIASVGGFVTGTFQVGYHQRLNSLGYVFSASSPPYLVVAAAESLDIISKTPELLTQLQKKSEDSRKYLTEQLVNQPIQIEGLNVSPLIHLRLKDTEQRKFTREVEQELLRKIVRTCWEKGVTIVLSTYSEQKDRFMPKPSLKIYITNLLDEQQLSQGLQTISESVKAVLEQ